MPVTVNTDSVYGIVLRSTFVRAADQIHLTAGFNRPFEDVVQVQLGAASERVVDIPPVDCQNFQNQASGRELTPFLRAITPMVGVV